MGPSACRGLLWLAGSCQEEIHCNAGNPVPRGRPALDSATEDDHRPRWTSIASRGLQDSRVHWELSQTLTGRRKDRVGDRWRNRCRSGFADAARRLRARVAAPATWTVQAPHNPTPQNLVPVMPSTSQEPKHRRVCVDIDRVVGTVDLDRKGHGCLVSCRWLARCW